MRGRRQAPPVSGRRSNPFRQGVVFGTGAVGAWFGGVVVAGGAVVVAGDGVAYGYLITITNSGPSDADNLVLDDADFAATVNHG